jgi:hypothetical protein
VVLGVRAAALVALASEGGRATVAASGDPVASVPASQVADVVALLRAGTTHARDRAGRRHLRRAARPRRLRPRARARRSARRRAPEHAIEFARLAAATFRHHATSQAQRSETAQYAALARAAKTLQESLDLSTLLGRICDEAAALIGADSAVIYRVAAADDLTIEAAHGLPPELLGFRMPAGGGLAGKVLLQDQLLMTDDYEHVGRPTLGSPWQGVRASLAVPVHLGGELRGVLSVA